ncbi:MAG: NAD(P)-dependent oxidoreductase [Candidatus Saganbacteria bacterium]|nr:NAD(P)-dependent oxidoreductase [Candidatus Saganbacteria bacterium]
MTANLLITGASGCVGHYIFDRLVKDPGYHLYLLLPTPAKLRRDLSRFQNVTVLQTSLAELGQQRELLAGMDYLVHLAAGWGNSETNYDWTKALLANLSPERLKKVIYFSTASILGPDNRPAEAVAGIGTSYITSKYRMLKELPGLKLYDRIITLFPTWVLGGSPRHPYSHAMSGIRGAVRWLWLLRFFRFDMSFHFIHAQDMAAIVEYLLQHDPGEREYVLGNEPISAGQLIERICRYYRKRVYFQVPIPARLVERVAGLFGQGLSEWDKYCLEKKDFSHRISNAATFGLPSNHAEIESVLQELT